MTLSHHADSITIDRLGTGDLVESFGFLDRDPVVNVYLLALTLRDAMSRPHDEYWAARRDGEIVGMLHLGGQSGAVLPVGDDEAVLACLAEQACARRSFLPCRFQVIGPRAAVAAVVERVATDGIHPRLHRDQAYLAVDRGGLPAFERLSALRPARREDFDLVYESGAQLRLEELGEDPRVADPHGYSRRVEEECRDRCTHLWKDRQGLCFRASVSALTPDAAQVSGVYTPSLRRNRGLARRGLSELCARLLERSRSVCLFVNCFNAPALALYERLGFDHRMDWASAFYETRR